jgi:hypothetical protein
MLRLVLLRPSAAAAAATRQAAMACVALCLLFCVKQFGIYEESGVCATLLPKKKSKSNTHEV